MSRARGTVVVIGVVAILVWSTVACVGDSPGSTPAGPAEGELGGPCFANSTCNAGLACVVVGGAAQCSAVAADAATDSASDGSTCTMVPAPSAFPCAGRTACYDPASMLSCTAAADACGSDGGNSIPHGCFSEKDCGAGDVCCLQDGATYALDRCPGALDLASAPSACGATLSTGSGACAKGGSAGDPGDAILCATSAGCPAGMTCYPVRLNAPSTLQGQLFGLCR